jgi:hypothetical protein
MRAAKTIHGAYGAEARETRRLFNELEKLSRTIVERVD